MKFLFVAKQKKNVDTFETTIAELLARGHEITLAVQQRDAERDRRLAERLGSPRFAMVSCPEERGDAWRQVAPLVRSTRDWAHYYQPAYARANKLHQRALGRLLRELGSAGPLDVSGLALGAAGGSRLREALAQIEEAIPSDPLHEEFIARHAPDVVLVSPGLHFGSGQSDFIKSARALGIPAWMLLFSWDNLSTKGALHVAPDRMFVWNTRQVQEADELHGYPPGRVVVVGAPRFDEFFALHNALTRSAFCAPLKLDPRSRTVLYLCSSRFIATDEISFIQSWLSVLRASATDVLRDCNVIVRPHPDVPLEPVGVEADVITWKEMPQAMGWVHRPFNDDRAIVLRTTYSTPQAFYECLHHADAVVALNTSAELEAGIAGRPVLTVLATGEAADGQAHTLHFDYLLREHGGFVQYSPDLPTHEQHLAEVLKAPQNTDTIRAFVMEFLRPRGNHSVAPLLAEALIEAHIPPERSGGLRGSFAPSASDELQVAVAEPATALATKCLSVEGSGGLNVLATPETRRFRKHGVLRVDPAIAHWLDEVVVPGDVFYDIGAGVGVYALVAAVKRGALAVAFEPGFAVYRTLCENVRLNGAAHGVIPLPIALTDRAGFFELEFSGASGGEHHVLRNREWRPRRETVDDRQGHPVCAERLDDVVARHGIATPNVMRIAVRREAERVLAGATALLEAPSLRSILLTVARHDDSRPADAILRKAGFTAADVGGSEPLGFSIRFDRDRAYRRPRSAWPWLRRAGRQH